LSSSRRRWLALAIVGLALGVASRWSAREVFTPRAVAARPAAARAATLEAPKRTVEPAPSEATPASFTRSTLPAPGSRARRKVWLEARYGPAADQLGKEVPAGEGEVFPPQGFATTADGQLVVLDSAKHRLAFFDAGGRMQRTLPIEGLVAPADVAVAGDGTLVVLDHEGVATKGLLMLYPDGRKKAELPQLQGALATGLYTVGEDIYLTKEGLTTLKAGETDGSASDETPGLYDDPDDGTIPGHVAPDGRTVVSAGIDSEARGEFFVTAIRGEPPEHLFTRHYQVPAPLLAIPYVQSDGQGDIYVVLVYAGQRMLACLDGQRGDAVGLVALPAPTGSTSGTPFREYSVVASGGLVYQQLSDDGSTYAWFDCH
jgi:hypothetical protein